MNIFLHEWICSGGLAHKQDLPSLANEGKTMFLALAEDLAAIPGVQVSTTIDLRVVQPGELPPGITWETANADPLGEQFRSIAARCDQALVVAPEVGKALVQAGSWLREAGCPSMGPDPEILAEAGDKGVMSRRWLEAGVRSIPTKVWRRGDRLPDRRSVIKLACGAGSWGNRLVYSSQEADAVLAWAQSEGLGEVLVQPYLPGIPISVAALIGPGNATWLEPCAQILAEDGSLGYRGGRVPLGQSVRQRAHKLGQSALACWPGLRGWTGLDMLLGENPDGSGDVVVELNPRCTTSYAGLRRFCRGNLVSAWMDSLQGRRPEIEWGFGQVCWTNAGKLEIVQ